MKVLYINIVRCIFIKISKHFKAFNDKIVIENDKFKLYKSKFAYIKNIEANK